MTRDRELTERLFGNLIGDEDDTPFDGKEHARRCRPFEYGQKSLVAISMRQAIDKILPALERTGPTGSLTGSGAQIRRVPELEEHGTDLAVNLTGGEGAASRIIREPGRGVSLASIDADSPSGPSLKRLGHARWDDGWSGACELSNFDLFLEAMRLLGEVPARNPEPALDLTSPARELLEADGWIAGPTSRQFAHLAMERHTRRVMAWVACAYPAFLATMEEKGATLDRGYMRHMDMNDHASVLRLDVDRDVYVHWSIDFSRASCVGLVMLGTRDPSGKVRSIDLVPLDEERILSTSLIDALSAGTLQDQKVVSYNADSGQVHFADGFASFRPVQLIATSLYYDADAAKELHGRSFEVEMVAAETAVEDFRKGMP